MARMKLLKETSEKIKCKYTGLPLNQADKQRHNSRAFYKLPNGEFMSRSTEAMRKYLDEQFPERVENEGCNVDKEGEPLLNEKYRDVIERLNAK